MEQIFREKPWPYIINLIIMPILLALSIILIGIDYTNISMLILAAIFLIIMLVLNLDILVYLLLAFWPIATTYLPEDQTTPVWLLIGFFIALSLLPRLITGKKFNLLPKEITIFFCIFWLLVILSNVNNLHNINLEVNIRILVYTAIVFVFYDWSFNKEPTYILISICIPLIITIVLALTIFIQNPSIVSLMQMAFMRFTAIVKNPNVLGGYLNIIIPVIFAFVIMKYPPKYYRLNLSILCLAIFCLVLTNSRSAYLGVGLSIIIISVIYKRMRLILAILIFAVLSAYFLLPIVQQLAVIFLRSGTDITSGRADVWIATLKAIKGHYIFGVGLGNQAEYITAEVPTAFLRHLFEGISGSHNLFIDKALELGILAIPLFLYLYYSFAKIIITNHKLNIPLIFKTLNVAGLGVLISTFIRSLFEGSVLIQQGGIFPIFYAWIVLFWPMQIYQRSNSKRLCRQFGQEIEGQNT